MPGCSTARSATLPLFLCALLALAPSTARSSELEGASLQVELRGPDLAHALLVLELPERLERVELTWLELGGTSLELISARLLGPDGAPERTVSPQIHPRPGPRPGFDLALPLEGESSGSLHLTYRAHGGADDDVTLPIPAPHDLLAPGRNFEVELRVPQDRSVASPFPAGLREVTRDGTGALYRVELPVIPSVVRFRLVAADRWWSLALIADLAVASVLLTLVAVGWRRFARMR